MLETRRVKLMSITVNIWSRKDGEIKSFLERFYQSEVTMDEDIAQWSYVYRNPLESVDIISALIDNSHKYDIGLGVQIDNNELYRVSEENHNDVIKGIFCLFYEEPIQEEIDNTY